MINFKKIRIPTPRLTMATPRLTMATPRLAESGSRAGESFFDYEYLREFEAKSGMAQKVV
jgi:hypothetical protein